ncbi:hypothetical protein AB4Y44_25015 [Paraburkholderia sp. BR10937]|uniref:hypothetical protein n=1 Tax=Paraburkholderia sp. BR10937 TaxID=3236994 RepID=UPI0034D1A58D
MKRGLTGVVAMLTLGACATVHESFAPNRRPAYTLNCSGFVRGWDKCFEAAGEICKTAGFDVIDRSDEDADAVEASRSGLFGTKTNERSMVIACKKPAA